MCVRRLTSNYFYKAHFRNITYHENQTIEACWSKTIYMSSDQKLKNVSRRNQNIAFWQHILLRKSHLFLILPPPQSYKQTIPIFV